MARPGYLIGNLTALPGLAYNLRRTDHLYLQSACFKNMASFSGLRSLRWIAIEFNNQLTTLDGLRNVRAPPGGPGTTYIDIYNRFAGAAFRWLKSRNCSRVHRWIGFCPSLLRQPLQQGPGYVQPKRLVSTWTLRMQIAFTFVMAQPSQELGAAQIRGTTAVAGRARPTPRPV